MARLYAHYVCLSCGMASQRSVDTEETGTREVKFPDTVTCGWRGCMGNARRRDV